MSRTSIANTPALWVNHYLQEKLVNLGFESVPFFPTTPSTINDLTEYFPTGGVMCTYDRMIRLRKSPFPHIKCEQLLYYFYATAENSILNMVKITEQTLRLLDREDESAEEINAWQVGKTIEVDGEILESNFRFHKFRIFQLQEARDIVNFGTARTYGGNKIIVEFDYHLLENPDA
jgi:hypothetical protein